MVKVIQEETEKNENNKDLEDKRVFYSRIYQRLNSKYRMKELNKCGNRLIRMQILASEVVGSELLIKII